MPDQLTTVHGPLPLPAFLPDATRAVVQFVDSSDLAGAGVPGVVVNSFHLTTRPGVTVVSRSGGIHRFMGWSRPVVSDSGGFQVFSLSRQSVDLVRVTTHGLEYRHDPKGKRHQLSPEKSIQQQFDLGSDVMFCLDYCTHPTDPPEIQQRSVELTIAWARRCKDEFDRRLAREKGGPQPLLFGVVQGGPSEDLRRRCADALVELGFDGYGFGGWPIDESGRLVDMVRRLAEWLPKDAPKHALGIGKPENLVDAFIAGYQIFDCVLPTRDARHGRVYVFESDWSGSWVNGRPPYYYLYIKDKEHIADPQPLESGCDCAACRNYSRGYINHLFQIADPTGARLATIHNLRFYTRLIEGLRAGSEKGEP